MLRGCLACRQQLIINREGQLSNASLHAALWARAFFFSRLAVFSPRHRYHGSASLNTHVSDFKHIPQSSEFVSSTGPFKLEWKKHLNSLFFF